MARNTTEANVTVTLNGETARNELKRLEEEMKKYRDAAEEAYKNGDKALGDQMTKNAQQLEKEIKVANKEIKDFGDFLKSLNSKSIKELEQAAKQLEKQLKNLTKDDPLWDEKAEQYRTVTKRLKDMKEGYKGVVTEGEKSAGTFKRLFGKVNEFYGGLTIYGKVIRAGLQAIVGVTKEVINASQTMGDKWNNAMDAMKSTTNAFFAALSTGDWSAFNDGLAEALKKARELAELKDLLGSFQIAGEYVQKEDLAKMTAARTKATDTEAGVEERKKALEEMKAAVESYNEFVTAQGQATYDMLIKSFDQMKGIQFSSEPEFKSFFDRLFRYSTTGRDEELNHALASYEYTWKELSKRYKDSYGQINQVMTEREAKEEALRRVGERYGEETRKLIQAVEINDKGHQALVQTYGLYADAVRTVEQQTRTYNRTRDQVNKQLYSDELKHLQKANNETLNIWKERYAKGIIDKATFEAKKLELEQQALQQSIELASKYGQDTTALYTKQWDDIIKQMEDEAKKAADAAEKAYQSAMKRVEKQESEQKLVWKRQYAAGLIDKQLYEARIAEVEEDFLKQKMATAEKYGKDTDQFMSQLLDRQIARMDKAKALLKEEMEEMARYQAGLDEADANRFGSSTGDKGIADQEAYDSFQEKIWQKAADIRAAITEDSARTEYETEVMWAQKLAEQKKITAEEAEKYILQAKLKYAQAAAEQVSQITEQASNFVTAIKEAESAQLEAQYQRQLTAAGDNAEERERIEAEHEQKKLDLQKKYADVEMAVNIAKTIANGAGAAIRAWLDAGPFAGPVLAALIAATTAAEIATIVAQRNAIKSMSVSAGSSTAGSTTPKTGERKITGYAEGGYTENHTTLTTVGERGTEWVAPAWMVRQNPVTFSNLENYRKAGSHGRSGSISKGFAEGGYTGQPTVAKNATVDVISKADLEEAVETAISRSMANGAIRAYLVRKDLTELDAQTNRFKNQTSR